MWWRSALAKLSERFNYRFLNIVSLNTFAFFYLRGNLVRLLSDDMEMLYLFHLHSSLAVLVSIFNPDNGLHKFTQTCDNRLEPASLTQLVENWFLPRTVWVYKLNIELEKGEDLSEIRKSMLSLLRQSNYCKAWVKTSFHKNRISKRDPLSMAPCLSVWYFWDQVAKIWSLESWLTPLEIIDTFTPKFALPENKKVVIFYGY